MLQTAYNLGIQLALAEHGLTKEAANAGAWQGIQTLLHRAGRQLSDFFTARKVREALARIPTATDIKPQADIPRAIGESVLSRLQQLGAGAKREKILPGVLETLQKHLEKSPYEIAKRELLKSLIPYAVVGGGIGLGTGGYLAAKKVYPEAFED